VDLEIIRELIAHDKWKTLETHRHQKEMLLLSRSLKQEESGVSDFNSETSHGQCQPKEQGLIALSSVSKGAKEYTSTLPGIEIPDLYSDLISISWCGKRLERWPEAKDAKVSLTAVNRIFADLIDEHGPGKVLDAISLIPDFDSRIVQDKINSLTVTESKRIIHSPLFTEFAKHYPYIELDLLEEAYGNCNENFVEAGVKLLRKNFPDNPPSEFSSHANWKQSCHQHLPEYLKQWQKDLRSIQTRMRVAQKAWTA
jgi:hypothetical protein